MVHRYARALRAVGLVRAAESRCRQAGDPVPDVVVVGMVDPIVASAFAGHGRWLFCEADPPRHVLGLARGEPYSSNADGAASGGTRGSRLRTTSTVAAWREVAGFLDPMTLPMAGSRERERVTDAVARLGLAPDDRVALLFGTKHAEKDIDLVARVFAELPDWQVVVGGRVGDAYRQRTGNATPSSWADSSTTGCVPSCTALLTSSS